MDLEHPSITMMNRTGYPTLEHQQVACIDKFGFEVLVGDEIMEIDDCIYLVEELSHNAIEVLESLDAERKIMQ